MRDPYLLTHLVSLAAIPVLLVQVMIGLAVGDPLFPAWLELFLLGVPPVALGVWLQWQRPLYPFSIWVMALPPQSLSDAQLRWLSVIRQSVSGWNVTGWVAAIAGIVLFTIFRQLYWAAPLAENLFPLPLRFIGILWAVLCFLALNLMVQMALTAARLHLLPDASPFAPYPAERIAQDFLILGRRSPKLWQPSDASQPDWVDLIALQWRRWRHPELPEKATLEEPSAKSVAPQTAPSGSELVSDSTNQPPVSSTPTPESITQAPPTEASSNIPSQVDAAVAHESQEPSPQHDTSSSD